MAKLVQRLRSHRRMKALRRAFRSSRGKAARVQAYAGRKYR